MCSTDCSQTVHHDVKIMNQVSLFLSHVQQECKNWRLEYTYFEETLKLNRTPNVDPAAEIKPEVFYLRRDREELSEINMFEVRLSVLVITCSTNKTTTLRFSDQVFDKIPNKKVTKQNWCKFCVFEPFRRRSARMFIGPELSTHTISFRASPQHECDALWETEGLSS